MLLSVIGGRHAIILSLGPRPANSGPLLCPASRCSPLPPPPAAAAAAAPRCLLLDFLPLPCWAAAGWCCCCCGWLLGGDGRGTSPTSYGDGSLTGACGSCCMLACVGSGPVAVCAAGRAAGGNMALLPPAAVAPSWGCDARGARGGCWSAGLPLCFSTITRNCSRSSPSFGLALPSEDGASPASCRTVIARLPGPPLPPAAAAAAGVGCWGWPMAWPLAAKAACSSSCSACAVLDKSALICCWGSCGQAPSPLWLLGGGACESGRVHQRRKAQHVQDTGSHASTVCFLQCGCFQHDRMQTGMHHTSMLATCPTAGRGLGFACTPWLQWGPAQHSTGASTRNKLCL